MPTQLAAIACMTILAMVDPAIAQVPGRQADEDACRPDVFRLCASAIPDETAIVACLAADLPTLSPACHAVMSPAPARRNRGAPPG